MKTKIIKAVSTVLITVILMMALSGCGYDIFGGRTIAEGYTGGFGIPYASNQEYWWVETYEECIAGINQLKSHGSTFVRDYEILPVYEGEFFDVKYYFTMDGDFADKHVKYGGNPFDRKVEGVKISAAIFLEDVEIDELVFSRMKNYQAFCYEPNYDYLTEENKSVSWEALECEFDNRSYFHIYQYRLSREEGFVFKMLAYHLKQEQSANEPSDEIIEALWSSLEIVSCGN